MENSLIPKISIIVPVYNVERYLEKCLKSLINQTLDDLEVIVVNDGSIDNSQNIIDDFKKKFPNKIKNFIKENGGLSDARNFGIDRAKGEFLAFVDSDDYISERMMEDMYLLAKKHDAEMVICNLQKINEKGQITQKLEQFPNLPEKILLKDHFSVFSDIACFACNKIFKRDLFTDMRFKKGMHFEDIELIPQLLLCCDVLAKTKSYHYQYFERSDSISKTHTERGLDILKAVENVEIAFMESKYANKKKELKKFYIFEAVYSFLAYLAFVKDDEVYQKMSSELKKFIKKRNISILEILKYKRFGKNYLLSLSYKKIIYYLLYFLGQEAFIRKLL